MSTSATFITYNRLTMEANIGYMTILTAKVTPNMINMISWSRDMYVVHTGGTVSRDQAS